MIKSRERKTDYIVHKKLQKPADTLPDQELYKQRSVVLIGRLSSALLAFCSAYNVTTEMELFNKPLGGERFARNRRV